MTELDHSLDGLNNDDQNEKVENVIGDSDSVDNDSYDCGDNREQNNSPGSESEERVRNPRESLSFEETSPLPQMNGDLTSSNYVKPKQRTINKVVAEKMQVVSMQKKIIMDELKERKMKLALLKEEHESKKKNYQLDREKRQCLLDTLRQEREHNKQLYELQKQEALLRKDVLQRKLLFFYETEEL